MNQMLGFDPHQTVLALMIDDTCRADARHSVRAEWFDGIHRDLFVAAIEHQGELVLADWAKALCRRCKGLGYRDACTQITEVMEHIAAPKNFPVYARHVREDWERRSIAAAALAVSEVGKLGADPLGMAQTLRTAADIARARLVDDVDFTAELGNEASRDKTGSVMTGFRKLDDMLGGLDPGSLTIVAARTSMGKTAFALGILRHQMLSGVPAGFASLEMSPAQLWERFGAGRDAAQGKARVWYPRARPDTAEIHGKFRQWAADGLGLVIVDYLQLIQGKRGVSKYEAVTEIVHELKFLARDLGAPLVVLCQLSRLTTQRKDQWPEMSDLRDSGAIEEDADNVILLHRPGYYDDKKDQREAFAILDKNRMGPTGTVRLDWIAPGHFVNHGGSLPLPPHIAAEHDERWNS